MFGKENQAIISGLVLKLRQNSKRRWEPWAPRKAVHAGAGAVNQKSTRWLVSSLLGAWWAVKWRGEEMIWFLRANRAELDLKLRLELGTEFNYQGEPQSRGMTSEDPVEGKHKETLPIH